MIFAAAHVLLLSAPLWIIPLTWWSTEYGVFALITLWPTYLLRTSIGGVPTTTLELSIYGLVLGSILHWAPKGGWHWPKLPRWYHAFGLGWILAWTLATIFSTDHQASLGALKAWLFDPMLFGAVVLVMVHSARQRTVILRAAISSGAIVATAGIVQVLAYQETLQDGRLSSFFHPVANYAAMYIGPLLVLGVGAVVFRQLSRRWWLANLLMATALTLTVSFGGYLAVGAGLVIIWWRWENPVWKKRSLMGAGVAVLLGLGLLLQTPYLGEKFRTTGRSSGLVRAQIWRTSIEMIKQHPLFGVGPNAYEAVYRQTIPTLYWPPLEWLVAQPHQLYLALWLEAGLLGVLVFLSTVVLWFRHLRPRLAQREPITVIAAAALITILVHGLVDTPLFKNDLVLLFLLILLLPLLNTESKNKLTE